ncbi:MAG TPA: hypothetical protein VKP65_14345 [Rhodothermales bacterium]|nr:hypothetical protein [Rhodothermales bacterium]
MEKISFRICVFLWIVALAVFICAAIYGGILLTSLFIFALFSAGGYNWFHSQKYGEMLLLNIGLPDSIIEYVDTTRNNFNEHNGVYFHQDTPPELIDSLSRLRRESVLVRVLLGDPTTGKVETVKVGIITWTPGAVAVPRLTYYDGHGGEVLEDHRIVRIINVVTSVVEYEGAGRMVDEG